MPYSPKVGGYGKERIMSATLTHRPEAPNSVSDQTEVPAPRKAGRWALVAAVAIAAAVGFAVTNNPVDDGSNAFAEAQRMAGLAAPVDSSHQIAEDLRFAAIGATVDSSVQYAETQRQIAAGNVSGAEDSSYEFAEFQRMQALADTSWQEAESRRFEALNPDGE